MSPYLPQLSIIIPAFNEEHRLPGYLDSILSHFAESAVTYEIVVVDDGSGDGTALVVERLAEKNPHLRLIRLPANCGKGWAVKTGMLNASGRLRLFADADGATPIAEFDRLQKRIEQGADVAIASRALRDDSCAVEARLHRKVIGSVFNRIVRILTVKHVSDTQCGFKLFTSDAAAELFQLQKIRGFGFDVEILYLAGKRGYRLVEVPVNWSDVEGSKVRLFRDSARMFLDVLKVRLWELRGSYS
jgi:dolichyl-phosphate beta-glucosyltransferase